MPLKVKDSVDYMGKGSAGQSNVVRDAKEQAIFFADLPVMADLYEEDGRFKLGNLGTFLISGVDRVIVSQFIVLPVLYLPKAKKQKIFVVVHITWRALFLCAVHGLILNLTVMIIFTSV